MTLTAEEKNAAMNSERAVLTQLFESALKGDFSKLRSIVDDYCQRNHGITVIDVLTQFKDGRKRTVLHFACQGAASSNGKDILEEILNTNWIPPSSIQGLLRMKDKDGLTPLMLVAQLADADLAEKRVMTLLDASLEKDNANTAQKSSKLGLARSHAGATALHYAAAAGGTEKTVKALYSAGQVAINVFSVQGGAPLHWACATPPPNDFSRTIRALLDCGADCNACQTADNEKIMIPPPLLMATAAGNEQHTKCIIQEANARGVNLGVTLSFTLPGRLSIYHVAADMNMVETLSLLVDKDNKSTITELKDERGLSPIDLAAQAGNVDCVTILLPGESRTLQDARDYVEKAKAEQAENKNECNPAASNAESDEVKDDKLDAAEARAQADAKSLIASASTISDCDKESAQEHKRLGNEYFAKNDWERAAELYTRAIEMDATDATFYSNRSACYINLKRPDDALYDAVVARYLRPDWPKAAYRMAVARLELGRFEDAAIAAFEGLQQDPKNDELKSLMQKCVKKGRRDYIATKKQKNAS